MNRPPYFIFTIVTFIFACSNSSNTDIKYVSWTGSSHSLGDTILSVDHKDTLYSFKYLYLAHHITFDKNGDGILITRSEYEAPRQSYSIEVADTLKKAVFDLLQDTSVLNFKQTTLDWNKEGRIYCGYNYLISITDNENNKKYINYLPPEANDKLKQLNTIFETILHKPNIKSKTQVDTLTLDSTILEKVIYFNPSPPLRSTVKFTPPLIEPDNDSRN